MSDLSKRFMDVLSRVEPKYGCMVLQSFIDDVGNERASEILDLSEGMMKYKNFLTDSEADEIVKNMINYDGSKGGKWSKEDARAAVTALNGKCEMDGEYNWNSLYATMEMKHSDEWGVLRNVVEPSKEAALCYELAKAQLLDRDGLFNVRTYFRV